MIRSRACVGRRLRCTDQVSANCPALTTGNMHLIGDTRPTEKVIEPAMQTGQVCLPCLEDFHPHHVDWGQARFGWKGVGTSAATQPTTKLPYLRLNAPTDPTDSQPAMVSPYFKGAESISGLGLPKFQDFGLGLGARPRRPDLLKYGAFFTVQAINFVPLRVWTPNL